MTKMPSGELGEKRQLRRFDNSLTRTDSMCLKGIAIVIMMFHHCFADTSRFEGYVVDFFPFTQNIIVQTSNYFKICVAFFVFITGYGLYLSAEKGIKDYRTSAKWTASRLIKSMSGFWFVYILTFIVTQIYAGYPTEVYCKDGKIRGAVYALLDFLGLANDFDTPKLCTTWWYMSAAVFFIIAIPVLSKFANKFSFWVLLGLLVFIPRVLQIEFPGGESGYSFIITLVFGMMFAKYKLFEKLGNLKWVKNEIADKALKFIPLLLLVGISIIVYNRIEKNDFWELHYAVIPMFFIYFCKEYIVRIPVVKQILAFFGKHSLNIFLIHTFIRKTFFQDFTYSFEKFWLIALVLFAISLGISIVIEALKKLIRFDKIIKAFSNKVCFLIDKI